LLLQGNRIISGLCLGVVVVEDAPRSGSPSTAHHAMGRFSIAASSLRLYWPLATLLSPQRPTIVRVRRLCRALSRSQHTPPDTVNMLRDATFAASGRSLASLVFDASYYKT